MRVFLGFALWIVIETWALGQAPAQPQPAFRADDFVNFVGINGSPLRTRVETAGPFKGGATYAPELFYDLGIRHYRMVLRYDLTLPDQPDQVRAVTFAASCLSEARQTTFSIQP